MEQASEPAGGVDKMRGDFEHTRHLVERAARS